MSTGYGPTCLRKIREAAVAEARADFSADQQAKADELIRDGGLVPVRETARNGSLYRAVSSKGDTSYLVTGHGCGCMAGVRGRRCYHVLAARTLALTGRRPAVKAPAARVTVPSRDIWAELEAAGALDPIPAF